MHRIVNAREAVSRILDGSTVAVGGAGAGHAVPDKILKALGEYFKETGKPGDLYIIHPCGIGDNDTRGLNHLAHEGLIRTSVGGFWGNAPAMVRLAREKKLTGYNLPQGVLSQLMRATAAGMPGLITRVGLHTFVDPRLEGGKINDITTEEIVEVMPLHGKEYLFYKTRPIDVGIIRGTTVDPEGNITMEEEVGSFAMLSIAQAAKTNGGMVIAQAKRVSDRHSEPGQVKVPGVLIDYVVLDPDQEMTFLSPYDPALVKRDFPFETDELTIEGIKNLVSRRAAMELRSGAFVNLGYGMSDGVPLVAQQEEITDQIVFMIEQGATAGIPTTGLNFGAMYNPSSIIDDGYQFDFFQGGGLDLAFLGFAQVDREGNINSSRFGDVITGCGGSIDISQNARKVVYCGTFAVKSEEEISENGVRVLNPGKFKKFVDRVQQVSFSGKYAMERGQQVVYVTERAVFELSPEGLLLREIAPGVDLQKDILDMMEFRPMIAKDLRTIDPVVYQKTKIGLKEKLKPRK